MNQLSINQGRSVLYGYSFLLYVIGCYVEEPMGLTNLKFSFNHMRVHEGAADRRFLTFFFPDLGRNCACGAKKDTSTVATSVVSFFFFFFCNIFPAALLRYSTTRGILFYDCLFF